MLSSRRLPLAVLTAACLIAASGASADPLDTFTAALAPSHVKPSITRSYTISLTTDLLSPNRAQRAAIGIPTGFTVDQASVQATTTAVVGSCDAATWEADGVLIANQKINLRRAGGNANALCPGATLTVAFAAVSAPTEGTYSWPSELVGEAGGAFTLSGPQPSVVVDGTAPAATIDGKPGNPSNDSGPSFTFSAGEPSTFECKLDAGEFAACSSPQTYAGLADGTHTFAVRATDRAGNVGPEVGYGWRIDTVAPTATIGAKPANPSQTSAATFSFTASEAGNGFLCRLDGAPFAACLSPKDYTGLGDGPHTFEVKATDQAGNTGPVDAFAWTIDTVAPTASIGTKPPNPSNERSASFSFSASENGVSFTCRLDTQPAAPCVSVKTYEALADGSHTFAVRPTDAAGNAGPAASYNWRIDTVAPTATITQTPSDPSNVSAPAFGFTASEAGSSFSCRLDDAALESCVAPKRYTALGDGPHTFVVKATDAAGNSSVETSYSWRIDTVAPTTTITEQPSDPSNDTSPTFSFRASETGSVLACKLDALAVAACTSPTTYPSLVEGAHRFVVRARDAAGNVGPEETYTWRIDLAAPTATITEKPSDPSNVTAPSFSFAASEAGSSFLCRLDGGTFESCTSPKSYPAVADGSHTFVVKATDRAGNPSAETKYTWTIDTVAPTATITVKPSDPSNDRSPSFAFAGGEPSTFECKLDAGAFAACTSPQGYSDLTAGAHTFAVRAVDPANNTGPGATYTWMIDTVAPTTTIGSKPTSPSASGSASFSFTANENGSSFSCRLDGAAFAPCPSPKTYTGLVDGSHTFDVRATDRAGNTGAADTYTWTIDTTAPTTAITDKPNDPTNESAARFAFAAAEPGSIFACRVDSAAFSACTSPKDFVLPDGRHTFQVRAADALGNVGPVMSYSWTIDTVAPSAQITQRPASPSNQSSPSFAFGSSEPGTTFACRLEEGGFAPCSSPKAYGPLADGQHAFAVRATDAAGNRGAAATHTWTIDTAAPTTTITGKPSNPSNSQSPSFSFTASEDGSAFACRLDGEGSAPCTSPAAYNGLGDGPHTFHVRAIDPAGNAGLEATFSWTIETRGPTVALISVPSGLSNSSGATFAFSADEPASFDCNLDGRGFEPCSSPATYHGLGDGTHTFSVRARDAVGNFSAPVGHSWAIDTTAPETTVVSAPKSGTATSATFSFAANEGGTFECRLGSAPFVLCTSPKTYSGLSIGSHQFEVRAIDVAGNADATPVIHRWTVTAPAAKKVASALLSPKAGARVTGAPLLRWRPDKRARYYNVQLYRGSRKVFTAWPTSPRLQLRAQWKYLGRTRKLVRGTYRWYVWPGYGAPSARRYGALLGQSTFVVAPPSRRR